MGILMTTGETRDDVASRIATITPERHRNAPRERFELRIKAIGETGRYTSIELETHDELKKLHERDGQYVTLVLEESEPRFFVLANQPGENWSFLIDPTESLAPTLDELDPGETIEASIPEGSGYPDATSIDELIIFATGSGIASVRSVLRRIDASKERPETWLFYGEELEADFAYVEELRALAARSVAHLSLVSDGRFVQHAFDEAGLDPREAAIFLCGAPVMMHAVALKLLEMGVSEDQFHTNL